MVTRYLAASAVLSSIALAAAAESPQRSLRPVERPGAVSSAAPEVVSRAATVLLPKKAAPGLSLRPEVRPTELAAPGGDTPGFAAWIRDFRPRALRQGISPATFDRAFAGVRFDPDVVRRDSSQAEFVKPIWDYLDSAASDARVRNGREALQRHADLMNRIEARYGVEKEVVAAVWGLETAYGTFRGSEPVIGSMASLAYEGRRRAFFEEQLVAALKILEQGHTTPANLKGSWAGAMGHTQFMPTSFHALAVDFTGDGRRDIWSDNPADALASTAHYLAEHGWKKGQPWGVEVQLPRGFDYSMARRDVHRMPSQWARMGVRDMNGNPVRDYGQASVLLPAGARGAAFLIFDNFDAIERYNPADAYVIGVGHLSDRLRGGGPIRADWPRGDRSLKRSEREELQKRLTAAGYDTKGIDGRIGPLTITALRRWQAANGLTPDGYPSVSVLSRMR